MVVLTPTRYQYLFKAGQELLTAAQTAKALSALVRAFAYRALDGVAEDHIARFTERTVVGGNDFVLFGEAAELNAITHGATPCMECCFGLAA